MPKETSISLPSTKRLNRTAESRASPVARVANPTTLLPIADNTNDDPSSLKLKITLLEKDLERRQESYISRERAYKTRIDELEEEINQQRQSKTGWMKTDSKMIKLKSMQNQIVNNVELVQDRTSRILQEQERDLLRAFRARLFDVQTELEKEKSKKDDGAGAWIERSHKLEAEVDWAKEVADRLERGNQTLTQENIRLKAQFQSQEDDRNFLIKQLVAVKKDNSRLRSEYSAIEQENHSLHQQMENAELARKASTAPRTAAQLKGDSEERYKEINKRLRRLLADERRSLQQVRQNYAQELRARTDMEMLLRQCVEDVRKEIARRHLEAAQELGQDGGKVHASSNGKPAVSTSAFEDFNQEDRERVLELLLSQERVVSLLYAKTFPVALKHGMGLALEEAAIDVTAALSVSPDVVATRPSTGGTGVATRTHPNGGEDIAGNNL